MPLAIRCLGACTDVAGLQSVGPACGRPVTPSYRWRLRGDLQGALGESPGVVGGSAQVFLAAPYMILTRVVMGSCRCSCGS